MNEIEIIMLEQVNQTLRYKYFIFFSHVQNPEVKGNNMNTKRRVFLGGPARRGRVNREDIGCV
jgi:hypothetical protein